MVYLSEGQDNEEEKKKDEETNGATFGSTGSDASGTQGGQGAAQSQGSQKFASFQDYISPNKAATQQTASKIADRTVQGLEQNKSQISGSANDLYGKIEQGKSPYSGYSDESANNLFTNVVDTANDPSKKATFNSYINASYGGPDTASSTSEYQKAVDAATKGKQTVEQFKTPGGLNQAVTNTYKNPTAGKAALDTALIQATPEAREVFKPIQNYASQFDTSLGDIQSQSAQKIQEAKSLADQARQGTSTRLGAAENKLQEDLSKATEDKRSSLDVQNKALKDALSYRNLTPDQLSQLGVTPEEWTEMQSLLKDIENTRTMKERNASTETEATGGFDPTSYLNQLSPDAEVNLGNVATREQYDVSKALEDLRGGDLNLLDQGNIGNAGTAPSNLSTYNKGEMLAHLRAIKEAQDAGAKARLDALNAGMDEEHAALEAQRVADNYTRMASAGAKPGVAGAIMPAATFVTSPVAGVVDYANGAGSAINDAIHDTSIKSVANALNATVGPKAIENAVTGTSKAIASSVSSAVKGAAKAIGKVFCFAPDTLVEMGDGTSKPIKDIMLGDVVLGGDVEAIQVGYSDHLNNYRGVMVTDYHAVKEEGEWKRVKDSNLVHDRTYHDKTVVYSLVTSGHRVYSEGVEFADLHETDDYELLSIDESLAKLNDKALSEVR